MRLLQECSDVCDEINSSKPKLLSRVSGLRPNGQCK